MSLPEQMLHWPQAVAQQVYGALFHPIVDMDPEQLAQHVPPALSHLAPELLSKALNQGPIARWADELNCEHTAHRLTLLPRHVIAQVSWNLGLLIHADELKKVVRRIDLQLLAQQGLDESAWQLIDQAPKIPTARKQSIFEHDIEDCGAQLRISGEQALVALAATLPVSLGQRLRWKLPQHNATSNTTHGSAPAPQLLEQAYATAVHTWSRDWDACLTQVTPQMH